MSDEKFQYDLTVKLLMCLDSEQCVDFVKTFESKVSGYNVTSWDYESIETQITFQIKLTRPGERNEWAAMKCENCSCDSKTVVWPFDLCKHKLMKHILLAANECDLRDDSGISESSEIIPDLPKFAVTEHIIELEQQEMLHKL